MLNTFCISFKQFNNLFYIILSTLYLILVSSFASNVYLCYIK